MDFNSEYLTGIGSKGACQKAPGEHETIAVVEGFLIIMRLLSVRSHQSRDKAGDHEYIRYRQRKPTFRSLPSIPL